MIYILLLRLENKNKVLLNVQKPYFSFILNLSRYGLKYIINLIYLIFSLIKNYYGCGEK